MDKLIKSELKWPGGRRKKVFKNRLKASVEGVAQKCVEHAPDKNYNKVKLVNDIYDAIITSVKSNEFKSAVSKK